MRFLNLIAAALLPLTALAVKKTPAEKFDAAWAKQVASGAAKLTDVTYETLTKGPRDHSIAVLLTALDARFSCQLCKDFQPEWDLVARSWTKGDKAAESKLLFGTLDFLDGKAVFQSVRAMRCRGIDRHGN
jgi:oligosaccharyltransferase complex subunit gamma